MSTALAQQVYLLNTRPTILHLPPTFEQSTIAGDERPDLGMSTPLMPGKSTAPVATAVPADVWERARKHKAVRQWLNLGWIREKPADMVAPTEAPPPADLSAHKEPAAIALVEAEDNEDTLRMWAKAERRPPVTAAINKRLVARK